MRRDLACGLFALVLAGVYLNEATKIQVSALGDAVGSAGFPLVLGSLLAGTALVLLLQAVLRGRRASAEGLLTVGGDAERPGSAFKRAAGLTAIAAAFIAMLPLVGYVVAVALMLAAVVLYQGLPFSRRTVLVAGGGALILYGLFGLLLGISVPRGPWGLLFD